MEWPHVDPIDARQRGCAITVGVVAELLAVSVDQRELSDRGFESLQVGGRVTGRFVRPHDQVLDLTSQGVNLVVVPHLCPFMVVTVEHDTELLKTQFDVMAPAHRKRKISRSMLSRSLSIRSATTSTARR